MTKPNILFIYSDQHRHDVMGCAGHPLVQTPNLDRLAKQGIRFSNVWCQSPVCQPSRASVITGQYTEDLSLFGNTGDFDTSWPTVMKSLKSVGYETATIGKTHYHGMPDREVFKDRTDPYDLREYNNFIKEFGWDHVMEEYDRYVHSSSRVRSPYMDYLESHGLLKEYQDQIKGVFRLTPTHWRGETSCLPQEHDLTSFIAGRAMKWLSERENESPFFLKLAFVQPHVPLIDDPVWSDYYRDVEIPMPNEKSPERVNEVWNKHLEKLDEHSQAQTMDEAFVRSGIRHYLGMVSLIDQKVGEVRAMLESLGQLDNTWIIYSSDHGEMLGEHHLWAKMNFYKGAVQVPLIIRPPTGCAGKILDELVESVDVTSTLAEIGGAIAPDGCRGHSLMPGFADEPVGKEFVRSRYNQFSAVRNQQFRFTLEVDTQMPCELFDLEKDPDELNNLVNSTKLDSVIAELSEIALARPGGYQDDFSSS